MSRAVRWELGGDATLLAAQGDLVTLSSERPFPPGAPARGTLLGEVPHALAVKVAGSRRADDGRFVVRARLLNPTAALRAAIDGALKNASG